MDRMRSLRTSLGPILGAAVIGLAPALAEAQCVMCSLAAENAGDPGEASRTLITGVLVLLVPTMGLLGGLSYLVWKSR